MGFIRQLIGQDAAKASKQAEQIQAQGVQSGISEIRRALEPAAGIQEQAIPALLDFVLNPGAQAQYATQNPLLKQIQEQIGQQVSSELLPLKAAQGKLYSGGTAAELQDRLAAQLIPIMLGETGRQQNALFNLAQMGTGAAQTQGITIADLLGSEAAARAAGTVGAANARQQGAKNVLELGKTIGAGAYYLSDERAKENIKPLGRFSDGISVYSYNYIGDDEEHIGIIAQEVEEVYPKAVKTIDGVKYVNYEVLLNAH